MKRKPIIIQTRIILSLTGRAYKIYSKDTNDDEIRIIKSIFLENVYVIKYSFDNVCKPAA